MAIIAPSVNISGDNGVHREVFTIGSKISWVNFVRFVMQAPLARPLQKTYMLKVTLRAYLAANRQMPINVLSYSPVRLKELHGQFSSLLFFFTYENTLDHKH